jgi:hypothetical protein
VRSAPLWARICAVDAGFLFALYAAAVATAGFVWQIYTWRRGRRLSVTVVGNISVRLGIRDADGNSVIEQYLEATVINRSQHPVRLTGVNFASEGEGPSGMVTSSPYFSLPYVIPAQDSHRMEMRFDQWGDVLIGNRLVAWVALSTGERFQSKPFGTSDLTADELRKASHERKSQILVERADEN